MASMIKYGIDLGTSNSLIACVDKGLVEVFKDPSGFKETLPSVVGFRNDRILFRDAARRYLETNSENVVSHFKRKMGTSETFRIKSLNASKSPVELSSLVLKELKSFVRGSEPVDAAVITIPASFDTVQSNATKEAGVMAGFKTVVLLQEPIAASLAYANKEKTIDLRDSQWLVYDLGGGILDVALVRIVDGELSVLDNEGDNYLGGTDFDALIVEKVVVPELEHRGAFKDLAKEMKSQKGRYKHLWFPLLHEAEKTKIELSRPGVGSAEFELGNVRNLADDNGKEINAILSVTRSEFETLIKDAIDRTTVMMKVILTRNSLQPGDLQFILMVGGSTYIPFVRKRVEEIMGISVNTAIDPTSAIAIGAAYFAGTKEKTKGDGAAPKQPAITLKVKASYAKASQEREETFTARIEGDTGGLHYRIIGEDGSYDSGLKSVGARIVEDLPLREGAFNLYTFKIYDASGNTVALDFNEIQITQGQYSIAGQVLPDDISLVTDNLGAGNTKSIEVFRKNAVLPCRAKQIVEVVETIVKGSDGRVSIIVVEGPSFRDWSTNKKIGILEITGKDVDRDLMKGSEIDLTFDMSESRDLTISAYFNGTGQAFSTKCSMKERSVSTRILTKEIGLLEAQIQTEIEDAQAEGNRPSTEDLEKVLAGVRSLFPEAANLAEDDRSDQRYQLEDKKRKLAQAMFDATSSKHLDQAKSGYLVRREEVSQLVAESGNDRERNLVAEIRGRELVFINSANPAKIEAATAELERVRWQILLRTPGFLTEMFEHLVVNRAKMNDQLQSNRMIDSGKRAIHDENWEEVRQINDRLWDLMPAGAQATEERRIYTNIVAT